MAPEKIPRLVIVGSLNMDLVVRVDRMPKPGETLRGDELQMIPGGKGANQAVAAAQLRAESVMIGRVGDDALGARLLRNLESFGVDADHVQVTEKCSSGVAVINVDSSGQNSITIITGANGKLAPEDLPSVEQTIRDADAVILQLEIPLETVRATVQLARKHGVATLLDPAPAPTAELSRELYEVNILTPNQSEAETLTGCTIQSMDDAEKAAAQLLKRGAQNVVLKLGPEGALVANSELGCRKLESFDVKVVDTTAAGDAFTAALALKYAQGHDLVEATQFACAAGSLASTKFGAQPSMPTLAEVQAILSGSCKT